VGDLVTADLEASRKILLSYLHCYVLNAPYYLRLVGYAACTSYGGILLIFGWIAFRRRNKLFHKLLLLKPCKLQCGTCVNFTGKNCCTGLPAQLTCGGQC